MNLLIYGYGNTNRKDDSLASEAIKVLQKHRLPHVHLEWNYLLNIDDAAYLAEYDCTIFVDATREDITDFSFTRLAPATNIEFSTHRMSPESVLAFCIEIYKKHPPVYLLAIKGYEWQFEEGLTAQAQQNLSAAMNFLLPLLKNPSLETIEKALLINPGYLSHHRSPE